MNAASDLETMEVVNAEKKMAFTNEKHGSHGESSIAGSSSDEFRHPTEEELATLTRVSGKIPWQAYTIAFVELCERFSYYGTTAVFVNFIQRPLPRDDETGWVSTTGAGYDDYIPGALGMGQRASTGLTTFNAFWAYIMPLVGAYMADQYWGRFKTIQVSIAIALVGHVVLIISAIPPVIGHPQGAIACFAIGIVIMGVGVGGFKSNISPLIAEQYTETRIYVTTDKKGNKVIHDPTVTISRIYLYFYMMINVGSLVGSIAMVYAERYVGFWLSYLLPTIMFLFCPMVLFLCKSSYTLYPPQGSTFTKACKVWGLAMKGKWSWNPIQTRRNMTAPGFWDSAKPSHQAVKPAWMTFDDAWVDEVRRGIMACKVFLWYPVYWLAYGQMTNNLTSQAATMELNGVPNDIISNLNPISIILFIPIMDMVVYPGLRKMHINFTPIKRITVGFFLASMAMVSSTVIQYYIYNMHPNGNHPNEAEAGVYAPINVWVQSVPYGLVGFSEILASITSLEYAYTKAPANMKSMVQAICLLMNAFSSALAQALVGLAEDPLLVWNYMTVAILAALGGIGFWLNNRKLDAEEDQLNMLKVGEFSGKHEIDTESGSEHGVVTESK